MVKYYIDEMQGESVVALHVATGETAIEAVQKVTSGPLVVRTSQTRWVRVVDERQSEVFKFAHVDRGNGRHRACHEGLEASCPASPAPPRRSPNTRPQTKKAP